MFLKEFLPDARPVAMNELQTLRHLQGNLPLRKWHAATAAVTTHQPFVPLLGGCRLFTCTSSALHAWMSMPVRKHIATGLREAWREPADSCCRSCGTPFLHV